MNNNRNPTIDEVFYLAFLVYHRRCLAGEDVELEQVWREIGGRGEMPPLTDDIAFQVIEMPNGVRESLEKAMWEGALGGAVENRQVHSSLDHQGAESRPGLIGDLSSKEARN